MGYARTAQRRGHAYAISLCLPLVYWNAYAAHLGSAKRWERDPWGPSLLRPSGPRGCLGPAV